MFAFEVQRSHMRLVASGFFRRLTANAVVLALCGAAVVIDGGAATAQPAASAPMPAAAVVPAAKGLIAFVSSRDRHDSGYDIYVMNADGTNPTRLTTDGLSDQPVISPDGKRIAFRCPRNSHYQICVMNADGTNPIDLTNDPIADGEPAFSPDGTHIAFSSSRNRLVSGSDIYVMNADGTNPTRLTTDGDSDQPVFSPDGKHIAFTSGRNGNHEIYGMNADGSIPIDLTNNPAADGEPAFSPDGTHIAFSSQGRDSPVSGSDIFIMNADGTNQTHLTTNRTGDQPAFSPDGKHIAFTSSRDGKSSEIYVMNTDGSNPVDLTNNPAYDAEPYWGILAAQQTATTTTLDVTPASPAAANTVETLKATVTPSGLAGSVQFKDGTTDIGSPVNVTHGTATLTTTLPPGTHALTAVFAPNDPTTSGSSTSAAVSYRVDVATGATATTTTLRIFPTRAFQGLPVVLLTHITPRSAAGTIQILDGTTALGGPLQTAAGLSLFITTLPPGTHTLTAVFTPTNPAAFAPSTSAPVSLTVNVLF
ncbi:MAG: PD40 domain-containing protein [Pseudonocardiales bacterium]|nr:PD40 domain-containing protein [Pseudonocardiales bacterium]MBV9030390.1 PD40 domain-containing protein [Pseudonocardiales bacterium]